MKIGFIGPVGVGKSTVAKSVAKQLNYNYSQASVEFIYHLADIELANELTLDCLVFLTASPETILNRINSRGQASAYTLEEVEQHLASYHSDALLDIAFAHNCSDIYIVGTDNKSADEVAAEVLSLVL